MLTPPARWCLLEGTILIGWYRNGNRKNHPPTCKLRAGGFALCDRKSYECLSASFPAFYLVVSGKKRNFAAKLDVELNELRMKQVEERYISLLCDKVFDRLFEEAEIAKFTPQEMREYEASKMAYRDIKNSIDTAKQEGLAEGMEKGMEKGMNQKALDIARNMLADSVDINLIMKYSGLTQEQIEKLK